MFFATISPLSLAPGRGARLGCIDNLARTAAQYARQRANITMGRQMNDALQSSPVRTP